MDLLIEVVVVAYRVVAFAVGFVLVWASLFLYEDEEQQLQSVLEEMWIRINDAHVGQAAVVKELAIKTHSVVDALLGPVLLSVRVVSVTISLGLLFLSVWFFVDVTYLYPKLLNAQMRDTLDGVTHRLHIAEWSALSAIFFLLLVFASANRKSWVRISAATIALGLWGAGIATMIFVLPQLHAISPDQAKIFQSVPWGWVLGVIIGVITLVIIRHVVAQLVQAVTVGRLITFVVISVFGCGLLLAPIIAAYFVSINPNAATFALGLGIAYVPEKVFYILGSAAAFGAGVIPAVVCAVIGIFLAAQRVMGIAVGRMFYALQRYKILQFRKLLAGIAIFMFSIAFGLSQILFAMIAMRFRL